MTRPYTGTSDGISRKRRPGLELLIAHIQAATDGALWNNGTLGIRNKRGKPELSTHATGRAADISWRWMKDGKRGKATGGRATAEAWMKALVENADEIGLELLIDYWPKPHGRGWKCTRNAWLKYPKAEVTGAPGGDWMHLEVSPAMAGDPAAMRAALAKIVVE